MSRVYLENRWDVMYLTDFVLKQRVFVNYYRHGM
jgi:hypothetical protein